MRGGLTAPAHRPPDPLQAEVDRRLDVRLDRTRTAPVALGLSGGGDSLALLRLAADWCARAGRPLLALTVDHGLSPESAGWSERAGRMAAEAGASWRALAWTGPKPSTGLPAAARAARHALLADAAREAGASVLLLAHTADDHAETEALRVGEARGIGRLREWAPSPAWPEGRGLFLLRPLLTTPREALREALTRAGLEWIEDPANLDPRFARVRARQRRALLGVGLWPPVRYADARPGRGFASPDGLISLPRHELDSVTTVRDRRAALACVSGQVRPLRAGVLARLLERLDGAEPFTTTVGHARIVADSGQVLFGREMGRRPPPDVPAVLGEAVVWDGRFEVRAEEAGWSLGAARGRLTRLPRSERELLNSIPPALREGLPVLHREGETRLCVAGAVVTGIVPARYDAAVGRVRREADIPPHTAPSAWIARVGGRV